MIGGWDLVFVAPDAEAARRACLEMISRLWPEAAFERGDWPDRRWTREPAGLGDWTELFAYRSPLDVHEWCRHGAIHRLQNTMIQLLLWEGTLTVVMGDPRTAEMTGFLTWLSWRLGPCEPRLEDLFDAVL